MTRSIQVFRTVQQVRQWRRQRLMQNKTVGFVPTMGALHEGHCHLVRRSLQQNDCTIVSIFVNPSQFAPHEDLDAYPRALDRDLTMLKQQFSENPFNAVFVPKVSEMYPSGIVLDVKEQRGAFVTVHGSSEQLEGALRPAFFRGVATVVTKLLNIVTPERVYFGQKDAQQCVIIKNLVKDLLIDTEVKVLETLRESNGLAMLSRNEYLSPAIKKKSAIIYQGLLAAKEMFARGTGKSVPEKDIRRAIEEVYIQMPESWEVDYIAISHPETLEDLVDVEKSVGAMVSVAVKVPRKNGGYARLIDNVQLV